MAQFLNFWPDFDPTHPLFCVFSHTQLRITSVFSGKKEEADILFSGEFTPDLAHDGSGFTWSSGGQTSRARWFYGTHLVNHSAALCVPLFYHSWFYYITRPLNIIARTRRSEKEFGVTFVVSNVSQGDLAVARLRLAIALAEQVPVHTTRRLRPYFPPSTKAVFHDVPDKLAFLERFQFNLCCENSRGPGYLTEKIFDAFTVGAVPLYWGDPTAKRWFFPNAFIDCADCTSNEVVEHIYKARSSGLPQFIDSERELLVRTQLYPMMIRFSDFASRVAGHLPNGWEKWLDWLQRNPEVNNGIRT